MLCYTYAPLPPRETGKFADAPGSLDANLMLQDPRTEQAAQKKEEEEERLWRSAALPP